MHVLHEPHDPMMLETLQALAQGALESPNSNMRIQTGSVTIACTSDVLKTAPVTFNKPFRLIPFLIYSANPDVTSSVLCFSYANLSKTGFTAQVYTSSTQNVTITYLAIGQV